MFKWLNTLNFLANVKKVGLLNYFHIDNYNVRVEHQYFPDCYLQNYFLFKKVFRKYYQLNHEWLNFLNRSNFKSNTPCFNHSLLNQKFRQHSHYSEKLTSPLEKKSGFEPPQKGLTSSHYALGLALGLKIVSRFSASKELNNTVITIRWALLLYCK